MLIPVPVSCGQRRPSLLGTSPQGESLGPGVDVCSAVQETVTFPSGRAADHSPSCGRASPRLCALGAVSCFRCLLAVRRPLLCRLLAALPRLGWGIRLFYLLIL